MGAPCRPLRVDVRLYRGLGRNTDMTSDTPFLEMRGIVKEFPGVRALSDVSLEVRSGEVHVLLGENGAGKSTLIKVLSGVYAPDAGEIRIDGQPVRLRSPHAAQATGHQHDLPGVQPRARPHGGSERLSRPGADTTGPRWHRGPEEIRRADTRGAQRTRLSDCTRCRW